MYRVSSVNHIIISKIKVHNVQCISEGDKEGDTQQRKFNGTFSGKVDLPDIFTPVRFFLFFFFEKTFLC